MGRRLFNLALLVLLGPFLVTFAYEGIRFVLAVFTLEAMQWFLLGAAGSVVIYPLLLGNSLGFVEQLLHELEHAALAFVFTFRFPTRMEIDPDEGSEVRAPAGGGCLTTLAPYYLPLLTLPFLLIKAGADWAFSSAETGFASTLASVLEILIGVTLTFHITNTIIEMTRDQRDFKEVGWISSFAGILFMNLMVLVVTVAVVTGSYEALWAYVKEAAGATVGAYQDAYAFLQERLLPALRDLVQWVVDWICERSPLAPAP